MVRQAVALQPMEVDRGADIHLPTHGKPTLEQAPGRTCGPVERSPRQSRFAGRTCDPVGDPRWSSLFLKVCTPWEGPTLEQLVEDCLLWEGPHTGAGAECEESSP
ncbi:zinc finger and BTB domain-containing protein 5 [Grus japonensis]|uniref:Zinc finger and BTB domain-containing protein 5 n=1 Tax=Grus japonensis TaxID=30415 RepID=A0ABC9WD41_GRUJA